MTRQLWFDLLLAVVAFSTGFTAGAILGNVFKRELVASKISGKLPHFSWIELMRFFIPMSFNLPGPLAHLPSVHPKEKQQGVCPILWRTPLGPFWGRSNEGGLLAFLMWEHLIQGIYEHEPVIVHLGDVVLDVGANLGTFTRFALNRGARRVIAFEPEPTNIACFKRTFKDELESGRVALVESAAWDHNGILDFSEPSRGNSGIGSAVNGNGTPVIKVQATTIDETVAKLNLDHVDFIKMDIEGSERHALRGARQSLARFVPRMALSVEHFPDDAEAIPKAVFEAKPDYHLIRGDTVFYFY